MAFTIESFTGVGPIRFGMTREEVRDLLTPSTPTPRVSFLSQLPTDSFRSVGIRVDYDDREKCTAVEFGHPSRPVFAGHKFLGMKYSLARKLLLICDPTATTDEDGMTCHAIGVGIYVPGLKKLRAPIVEGVIAFGRGYYAAPTKETRK